MALGQQRLDGVGVAPDDQGLDPAHSALMDHLQLRGQRQLGHQLDLDHIVLQGREGPLQQHFAAVHDAHMVADVLQLPEVVGGDQHRGAVLGHVLQDEAHDLPPHHRVQTVHGLVENQQLRAAADGQPEGRLLLHALGEPPDGLALAQLEAVGQQVKEGLVEPGIDRGVEPAQIPEAVAALVEDLVGDIDHTRLLVVIFIDRLLVQGDRPAVGPVNAHETADQRGFARAVGAHQAVDRAPGHRQAQIVQSPKAAEGLGQRFDFKHS